MKTNKTLLFSVQDIVFQLQRFVSAMAKYHNDCHAVMKEAVVFPIEVDLSRGTFTYDTSSQFNDGEEEEEEEEDEGEEATEGGAGDGAHTGDLISTDWVWQGFWLINVHSFLVKKLKFIFHISMCQIFLYTE